MRGKGDTRMDRASDKVVRNLPEKGGGERERGWGRSVQGFVSSFLIHKRERENKKKRERKKGR